MQSFPPLACLESLRKTSTVLFSVITWKLCWKLPTVLYFSVQSVLFNFKASWEKYLSVEETLQFLKFFIKPRWTLQLEPSLGELLPHGSRTLLYTFYSASQSHFLLIMWPVLPLPSSAVVLCGCIDKACLLSHLWSLSTCQGMVTLDGGSLYLPLHPECL